MAKVNLSCRERRRYNELKLVTGEQILLTLVHGDGGTSGSASVRQTDRSGRGTTVVLS